MAAKDERGRSLDSYRGVLDDVAAYFQETGADRRRYDGRHRESSHEYSQRQQQEVEAADSTPLAFERRFQQHKAQQRAAHRPQQRDENDELTLEDLLHPSTGSALEHQTGGDSVLSNTVYAKGGATTRRVSGEDTLVNRYDKSVQDSDRILGGEIPRGRVWTAQLPDRITEGDVIKPELISTYMGSMSHFKLEWFICSRRAYPEYSHEIPEGEWIHTGPDLKIRLDFVGKYIKLVVSDRSNSDPSVVFSATPVRPGLPRLDDIQLLGDILENYTLTVLYVYFGHHEGSTSIRWFRDTREIPTARGKKTYTTTHEDLGHRILVEVIPVRCDGTQGIGKTASTNGVIKQGIPKVEGVEIVGGRKTGDILRCQTFGQSTRNLGSPIIKWYRINFSGTEELVKETGALGAARDSDYCYVTTPEDSGCRFKVEYTPVRKDGAVGAPVSAMLQTSMDELPIEQLDPRCNVSLKGIEKEGETLEADFHILQGLISRGASTCKWLRDGSLLGIGYSYHIQSLDIGCILTAEFHPVSPHGLRGFTVSTSTSRILPGDPHLVNTSIEGRLVPSGTASVKRTYIGGVEKGSTIQWCTVRDGVAEVVSSNSETLLLTRDMVGAHIRATYTPRRMDGVWGNSVHITSQNPVQRAVPIVAKHTMRGIPEEGRMLKAVVDVLYPTAAGTPKVKWFRNQILIAENVSFWKLVADDVGHSIKFEYTPYSGEGEPGEMVYAISPIIRPGRPVIEGCYLGPTITGTVITPAFTLCGTDVSALYVWDKSRDGIVWTGCANNSTGDPTDPPSYLCTADDLYHFIRVKVTPTSARDGAYGDPAVVSTLCKIDPNAQRRMQEAFLLGTGSFKAFVEGAGDSIIDFDRKQLRIVDPKGKVVGRSKWGPHVNITIDVRSDTKFFIAMDDDNSWTCTVTHNRQRDVVVLVLRVFVGMYMPECAQNVFDREVVECWESIVKNPKNPNTATLTTALDRAWMPPVTGLEKDEIQFLNVKVNSYGSNWLHCLNALRGLAQSPNVTGL
eukprot:NODE_7_length_3398_cov_365.087435_g6_i0.p1 GENE.NODE_7_length_3398_cov_365.087435_g6_i0~~NODE_7_length_3398_cov_365.087435_g6_i0.p1  ORF type:complete len:1017 (+),score=225.13 NODE_7_length_3398_cov_365.087435_g6_i0:258-3308(+)